MNRIHVFVFRLYERRNLRNWFYTIAFAIFVPVGYRFADIAWRFGDWFDRPLAVLAGLLIGIATIVTLLRIWRVPPSQVVTEPEPLPVETPQRASMADEILAVARRRSAQNRDLAAYAAALGSSRSKSWH